MFLLLRRCQSLRKLLIFEESLGNYCRPGTAARRPPAFVGRALCQNSRLLRELRVGRMIDARDFLLDFLEGGSQAGQKGDEWHNLEHLSLSTEVLPTRGCGPLLVAAAAAARRMPKLKTLGLWGRAALDRFAYVAHDRRHAILLPPRMGHAAREETVKAWREVVSSRGESNTLWVDDVPEMEGADRWRRITSGDMLSQALTATTVRQRRDAEMRRLATRVALLLMPGPASMGGPGSPGTHH